MARDGSGRRLPRSRSTRGEAGRRRTESRASAMEAGRGRGGGPAGGVRETASVAENGSDGRGSEHGREPREVGRGVGAFYAGRVGRRAAGLVMGAARRVGGLLSIPIQIGREEGEEIFAGEEWGVLVASWGEWGWLRQRGGPAWRRGGLRPGGPKPKGRGVSPFFFFFCFSFSFSFFCIFLSFISFPFLFLLILKYLGIL